MTAIDVLNSIPDPSPPLQEAEVSVLTDAQIHQVEDEAGRALGRNAILRALMDEPYITPDAPINPGNYETAVKTGLLDAFYDDPETGFDAAIHILAGDVITDPRTGATEIGGYHHEPSALHPDTGIDEVRMTGRFGRREYKTFDYEPYQRKTIIEGYEKPSNSVMFPREYDPLAVLQSVKLARDTRDRSQDGVSEVDDKVVVATGHAKMLDGKTGMEVRLILDKETDKIVTAMPRAKKGQLMTDLDARKHLGLED